MKTLSRNLILPLLLGICSPAPAFGALSVTNFVDRETVSYPVVLLEGRSDTRQSGDLTVTNETSTRPTRRLTTQLFRGRFKALVELVIGKNEVLLETGDESARLTLTYQPQSLGGVVRMVYLTDSSGNTAYESPLPNDPQNYEDKLDTAAKLMQTFTAESLRAAGYGRRTFNLELDENGRVRVHVFRGARTAAAYHQMTGNELYDEFYGFLDRRLPMSRGKNVAIMAFSHYDTATREAKAHTALGGGGLGLFGGLALFSWPNSLQDVQRAFLDPTRVDPATTFDDSAFRSTYWGLASTTLGATLHEMGHTFGLPHSEDPFSVMSRGFDHFNRRFTFYDPPSGVNGGNVTFNDRQIAYFDPPMANLLTAHAWIGPRPAPAAGGFQVEYRAWSGASPPADAFSGPALAQATDAVIARNWDESAPAANVPSDRFSVRWVGKVQPRFTETYRLYATSDDGIRVWLDGKLVIDSWRDQGATTSQATAALEAGRLYDLKVEYYENGGGAMALLEWSSPSTPRELVPAAPQLPRGDVNRDGGVTVGDVLQILRWVVGMDALPPDPLALADLNGNGRLEIGDAVACLRLVVEQGT